MPNLRGLDSLKKSGCTLISASTRFQLATPDAEVDRRAGDPCSSFDRQVDGYTFSVAIDEDGLDVQEQEELDLLRAIKPGPWEWFISACFFYDALRFELTGGLPLKVAQMSGVSGAAVITGVKFMIEKPTDYLRGGLVDVELSSEGQVAGYWINIFGFLRHSMDDTFIDEVLNKSIPHANLFVRMKTAAPAGK